jgi:hypothetical protein
MADGRRRRRHSEDQAKRRWYAIHRARRFRRRFWLLGSHANRPSQILNFFHRWPSDTPTDAIV